MALIAIKWLKRRNCHVSGDYFAVTPLAVNFGAM